MKLSCFRNPEKKQNLRLTSNPTYHRRWLLITSLLCTQIGFVAVAHSQDALPDPAQMTHCRDRWQADALQAGLSKQVVENIIPQLRWLPETIELDRRQPEFSEGFAHYFNARVTADRISRGRELFRTHQGLLKKLTQEYGVPGQYLIAFWGMETNYGRILGRFSVLDTLATLACDTRRSAFFTTELFSAFRLIEQHTLEPSQMKGSWAGAMGHVQFMPSNYLKYAINGDANKQVDLWGSTADALTSAAHFLQQMGWQTGFRWGREVSLSPGFAYHQVELGQFEPVANWIARGVKRADGRPLEPVTDLNAALLLPSGYRGPAFLVYDNFNIMMGWNRSEHYALCVGHLADRIAGAGHLSQSLPVSPRLLASQVKALQSKLSSLGFDVGSVDGIAGAATRRAIREFQRKEGMIADGYPSEPLFEKLEIPLAASDSPNMPAQ
jgi:membrane-bound lytic murein transglycosylase B